MAKKNRKLLYYVLLFIMFEVILLQLPIWADLDSKANDYLIKYYAANQSVDADIVIVDIDDKSLLAFEMEIGRWPWPRSVYGYFLEGLSNYKPSAIVFDIMFSEKDLYRPDSDLFFNEAAEKIDNIYFASSLISDQSLIKKTRLENIPSSLLMNEATYNKASKLSIVLPSVITQKKVKTGLINYSIDADGVSRRYNLFTKTNNIKLKSLPIVIFEDVLRKKTNASRIRLNYKGIMQIPYSSISFIDAYNLLESTNSKKLDSIFKNKIIIIGTSASGLHDLKQTPVSAMQPAVTILATAIDNLKNNDYYQEYSSVLQILMTVIITLCLGFLLLFKLDFRKFLLRTFLSVSVLTIALILLALGLAKNQQLIPIASPLIFLWMTFVTLNLYKGFSEYLARQRATQIFGRFMDPRVVSTLVNSENWKDNLKTRSGEITVLFSDIRGFTSISESREAEEVIDLLNRYFDSQVEVIFKFAGTLDKFIGDAIMAFWGAPISDDKQAKNGVSAALEMSEKLDEFVKTLPIELQNFDIGIGVHTGPAVVGMLGSSKRYDYTAIGDTVNLASRIEGVTKGRARVLVSDATKVACKDDFIFKPAGNFEVKGRKEPVKLWEPFPLNVKDST